MVHYKLHYFDTRGLAESIRMLLNYAGQEFEDVRFTMEQWPGKKDSFFYGKVPVLEIDGKQQLGQSSTIARYLGEKFHLAGKDDWERAHVNEVVDFHKDVSNELAPYFYTALGYREGDKDKLRKETYEPAVARCLPLYEKLLKQSGSGFFAPSGVSYVDFIVAEYLDNFRARAEPDLLKAHPELAAFVARVLALPQLQKYLSTRKTQ